MKRILIVTLVLAGIQVGAQNNNQLLEHYEAYYEQMKSQGDVRGVIDALTHLNILEPSQARKDTIAVLYMNQGMHLQALNTIGIDINPSDSNMAVETKAMCLQALNQNERAIEQYEELFKRSPNALIAYELADLKTQMDDLSGALSNIEYGMANANDDMMRTFYESQTPYQVPVKAAFLYMKSLIKFKENRAENIDAAVAILDEALQLAPHFNLAKLSKDALLAQKEAPVKDN